MLVEPSSVFSKKWKSSVTETLAEEEVEVEEAAEEVVVVAGAMVVVVTITEIPIKAVAAAIIDGVKAGSPVMTAEAPTDTEMAAVAEAATTVEAAVAAATMEEEEEEVTIGRTEEETEEEETEIPTMTVGRLWS